jgi:hypothetical protein
MRHRQERFLSLIGPNAEGASVTVVDPTELPGEITGELRTPLTSIPADIGFSKPDELTWWDWTVLLLHTADGGTKTNRPTQHTGPGHGS